MTDYIKTNFESLYPPRYLSHVWNELAALRTFKITEKGPLTKKVWPPLIYTNIGLTVRYLLPKK